MTEHSRTMRIRAAFCFWLIFLGFAAVIYRAVDFQVSPDPRLVKLSTSKERWNERKQSEGMLQSRGAILDSNNEELALSLISKSFFANPRLIKDPEIVAPKLARHLRLSSQHVENLLKQDRYFVWLKREVPEEQARQIESLNIQGVHASKESRRVYPHSPLAQPILGISGRDGTGLEGVEREYNRWLETSDQAGELGVRDALGRLLLFRDFEKQWFESHDIQLTLDLRLQRVLEAELKQTLEKTGAIRAQGALMDPHSGAILAMATVDGDGVEPSPYRNRIVSDNYEPGSTFKLVTALAAMEDLGLKPTSQIFAENGRLQIAGRTVREYNSREFAWISLEEMLVKSSNVAAAKLGLKLGAQPLYEKMETLGMLERTGIDLPGEARGIVRKPSSWKPIDIANISFGQGAAFTPLQMLRAFAVIANGGYLVRPHVVSKIRSSDTSELVWESRPERTEVLSADLTRNLTKMLTQVTDQGGTGSLAAVPGFQVAGKTGTAQKLVESEEGGKYYSSENSRVSFIGYVPAGRPRFIAYVMYDDPKGHASGGATAAPSFRRFAERSLGILGVQAEKKLSRKLSAKPADGAEFIGKSFSEVLNELEDWDQAQRMRVELFGYGKVVKEEKKGEKLHLYFE